MLTAQCCLEMLNLSQLNIECCRVNIDYSTQKMGPKKRVNYGKSAKAKKHIESMKKLSPNSKKKVLDSTKERVQCHRSNLDDEKQQAILQKEIEYEQSKR